jgi:hypothetical protein
MRDPLEVSKATRILYADGADEDGLRGFLFVVRRSIIIRSALIAN